LQLFVSFFHKKGKQFHEIFMKIRKRTFSFRPYHHIKDAFTLQERNQMYTLPFSDSVPIYSTVWVYLSDGHWRKGSRGKIFENMRFNSRQTSQYCLLLQ
jgi:hypothetical protein